MTKTKMVAQRPILFSLCLRLCVLTNRLHVALGSNISLVTVDAASTTDCSKVSGSLANLTCSSLQDVLVSVSVHITSSSLGSGDHASHVEIRLLPGHYVLTRNFTILGQNLKLVGENESHVIVSFNISDGFDPTVTHSPLYVLSLVNSSLIEIRGISFWSSPGIITAHNVDSVLVDSCSFRYFFQGAVDFYNCASVTVLDSIFEHNGPASIVKPEPYRGHSGGLSIGYYGAVAGEDGPRAFVSNCTFRNNTSDPNSVAVQSTSDLFQRFAFTGRGGGCAFTISPSTSLTAVVENSTVEGNFARSFGGGLYVGFDGNLNHTVTVNRVLLIRNECPGAAGGLEIGFVQGAAPDSLNRIFVLHSQFIENRAAFGAGTYFFTPGPTGPDGRLSNFGHFENCTFTGNVAKEYGAAIGSITLLYFQDMVNLLPLELESCSFIGNDDGGGGGVLSTAYVPLRFSGHTVFTQNRGRTLVVIGSHVEIRGGMHFVDNNGASIDGGAMYITSLGQLELFRGANITFTGNTGVIGAGIVIDNLQVPPVYSQVNKNPLCTLLYEEDSRRPSDWEDVFMKFSGNRAIIASSVHLNNLNLCSWVQNQSPWFEPSRVFHWGFVEFSETNRNTAHEPDDFNQEWSVQTSAVDIEITSKVTTAYPGEQFLLGIQALDEIGRSTSDIIRISDLTDRVEQQHLFEPSVITLSTLALGGVNISYLTSTNVIGEDGFNRDIQVETLLGSTTFASAELHSRKCLPGYVLTESSLLHGSYKTCQCDTNNTNILDCIGANILLRNGLWATTDNCSACDTIVMYPCPPGYCQCVPITDGNSILCQTVFRSSDPDTQCSCDRRGELCGECRDGKGVSALLNKCITCSSTSGLLIALLLVLDAAVFAVLLNFMKPFPSWIYPCVFYIQVLPYLTEYFPTTFDKIQPPLYYINSGLSFYFIYDFCLYSNMSPLVSYFLRYLPLFTAVITATVVLGIRRNFKKKALSWYGLWWIILLMYSHLLHTSMSILNCPILPARDGSLIPRWYIDGTVKCFTGGHAVLGLLAILVLTACVAIIPLSLTYITGKLRRPWVFRRSFEPLAIPFKEQYKWWSSVELGRRIILVLFVVAFPQNEYAAIFVLMITVAVYGYVQPFECQAVNILETFLSINTIVLLLLRNTDIISENLGSLGKQPSHNDTNICRDEVERVTDFSWLLLPVYYLPLVTCCTVGGVWIALKGRQYYVRRHDKAEETLQEEHLVPAQSHGVTEYYLNVEDSASGEVAMVYYRPIPTESTSNS